MRAISPATAVAFGAVAALASCSGGKLPTDPQRDGPSDNRSVAADAGGGGERARTGAAEAPTPDAGVAMAAKTAAKDAVTIASRSRGHDFIAEARMLYRVAACAGDEPIPAHLDSAVVNSHCRRLDKRTKRYRKRYVTTAKEFIAALRPKSLPERVVYPFGGGDLISALVVFPDATEITTLSLEHGGDPRRIREFKRGQLRRSLGALSVEIGGMLSVSNNTSKNLSHAHKNLLPGQLSSFLIGLAVHDFEPTSVRYFALEDDGRIRYLEDRDIAEMDAERARRLKFDWDEPNFSPAFSHVEIRFRRRGGADGQPERVHRHIAANLADRHLAKNPGVLAHLRAKGRIVAMTKAASYLLWRREFSRVRDYLLDNMDWMLSDSTGIPPAYAHKAGMEQTTFGLFESSFLEAADGPNEDFRKLWRSQPYRKLPFRFGYVDSKRHAHLVITRPADR